MEKRHQNTEVDRKKDLNNLFFKIFNDSYRFGMSAYLFQIINTSFTKSLRVYQEEKYHDSTIYFPITSLYTLDRGAKGQPTEVQKMWNFAGILMTEIWGYPEIVPYQERMMTLPFDIVQNLDEKTRNDVVNLYRKASSPYGLRVRACDDCYFIYWDEIQLANTPLEELGIDYYQLMVQNKGNKEKVNKTLEKILRK